MSKERQRWLIFLGILFSLLIIMSACATQQAQAPAQTVLVYPTIIITQYVTQIVATATITPTPLPTSVAQAIVPTVSTGWDPFGVQIYYPIRECVASRLHVDDVAFVAYGSIGIHWSENVRDAPKFRELAPGELVDIVEGPWCNEGTLVWKVDTADGYIGFVPEGNGEVYWLLPMPPGTDRVLPEEEYKIRKNLLPGETLQLVKPKSKSSP